jgi:tetratricopeptide (TPR) repeat protein
VTAEAGSKTQDEAHETARRRRTRQILLLLILLLALALRLWLWSRPAHPLANDETEYFAVGMDLAHGRGWVFYDTYRWLRAPLYPLFLGAAFWLGQDHARLATLAQVLLSTATVYGFYLLGRRLFRGEWGTRAGLIGALLAALLLPFATFPSLFMAETLFTFLLVAFLLALLQVPEAPPARRWRWTLLAGALLGLCALTRAVGLAFLPLAAGWLFLVLWGEGAKRRGGEKASQQASEETKKQEGKKQTRQVWERRIGRTLVLPMLLAVAGLATIAPWTVRNAVAYQRFIPLDTGASYSLWAFYEPHEELDAINRALEAIPNPADRQAYAVSKWQERLREDPTVLLRHVAEAFPYLLRVKPIEDRFLPLPYREPSLPYFVLALLLDDGLYVLIAIASLAAFLFAPMERGKALALLWLVYNVGIMIVLHAEARYRQLLFPAMIPYAGLALAQGWRLFAARNVGPSGQGRDHKADSERSRRGRLYGRWVALGLLLGGWAYCFITYFPWSWAAVNLQRGFYQVLGQANWTLGRPEATLAAYRRAAEVDEHNPEPYYDWGTALEHLGRLEEAAQVYRWGWDVRSTYLPCSTALGNVLHKLGQEDEARIAFRGRYVDEEDVIAWAWEHLDVPPAERLDLGDGLDFGYVAGVHAGEAGGGVTFRWTTAQAQLRLTAPRSGNARLRLRMAAPRLKPTSPVPVEIWQGSVQLGRWEVSPAWDTYETAPFQAQAGREVRFVLRSPVFVPQQIEPGSPDTRALGIQLDWAELVIEITGDSPQSLYNAFTPFP